MSQFAKSPYQKTLRLRPREEKRIHAGHQWVFSNEVDLQATPLSAFSPGELAILETGRGHPLGVVFVNPHSLICARIVSRRRGEVIDHDFVATRIATALSLRESLFSERCYRLFYGESDDLPGLIVDRYGDYLVVQLTTAGCESLCEPILDALERVLDPRGILLRNDGPMRDLEGLPREVRIGRGDVPDEAEIIEAGLRFSIPLHAGQKTGWFFDQRENRIALRRYARDRSVLDLFSYVGGWAVNAAAAGASSVTCVDSSQQALDHAGRNAVANGFKAELIRRDVFDLLDTMVEAGQAFDIVVVDPPALIKRRKDSRKGAAAYGRLNRQAIGVVRPGGILVSCSCSHHLDEAELISIIRRAAIEQGRKLQILEIRGQSPDHPIHPAMPETRYLKCLFCRVL